MAFPSRWIRCTVRAAGGEILERGTHEELLARGGRYRELYERQYAIEQDLYVNPGEDWTPEVRVVEEGS
jgi:hypothetical protein